MVRNLIKKEKKNDSEICLWKVMDNQEIAYEIVMNGVFIMASYNRLSSEKLIKLPLEKIKNKDKLEILIGGLGMGFTVNTGCLFPSVAHIDVVEIKPIIIEWNKIYFKKLHQNCLENKRVHIIIADFYDYVTKTKNKYDIVCMAVWILIMDQVF